MATVLELKNQADVFDLPVPTVKAEVAYFDRGKPKDRAKGLALRVRSDGSRTFAFFYRFHGKQRKLTLGVASGDPSGWTLAKARTRAHALRVCADGGTDPAAAKIEAAAAAIGAKTFKEAVDAYLAVRARTMKPRSLDESRRHLENQWRPFHRKPVHEITTDMVADRLAEIERESGVVSRNRARSTLSAMFAWALGERFAKQLRANPVAGTIKAVENRPRDRILTDAELVAIWNAAPAGSYGRIVRLLMLTGQRREEIGGLCWSEIKRLDDAEMALIELPGDRTKNSRAHEVPLSPLAIEVLSSQPIDAERDLIFGEGEGGYSGWSRSKAALDDACGVTDWTLHDLRRSAATRMADLGVQPHVIEAVLNHVSGHKSGVAGIYNRSSYAAEKRAALNLWANHLRVEIAKAEGGNIVKMTPASA